MASGNDKDAIKITLDDLAQVTAPETVVVSPASAAPGSRSYGTISEAAEPFLPVAEERASLLLQGWFYLGAAGVLGAILAWAVAEPSFQDGEAMRWGNVWMIPLVIACMSMGFGVAESAVERSARKALVRGALSLPLGIILGFFFSFVANIVYGIGIQISIEAGAQSSLNPALWIARGIAWMAFGVAGGIVYGIIGQSSKKAKYGILGGMIGAGLGGMVFDPIAEFTNGGEVSRAVGFALVGIATGVGMGIVESALKDRWLYVTAGPLAGKQFILYKSRTTIGSRQDCDIYLFKDPSILPQHAGIEISGVRVQVLATGNVYVAGQPIHTRVLQNGDLIQVGRYSFRYKEKQRS